MNRPVVGVAVASVVVFFWGFLVWGGAIPYRTKIWRQPKDSAVAAQMLKEQFPNNGTYFVPSFDQDPAAIERQMAGGAVAMVHILAANGRPLVEASIMVQGFVVNVVALVLICLLMRRAALPTFGQRVQFAALLGVTAAVLIDCGDAAWWQMAWDWKLYQAFYHVTFCALAGCFVGGSMPAKRKENETSLAK